MYGIVFGLALLSCVLLVLCEITERDLTAKIFMDYDKRVRPVKKISKIVQVNFTLSLSQIQHIDEKNQLLHSFSYLTLVSKCLFLIVLSY